jgi:hypothetical protein
MRRRRENAERIEAKADALIRDLGVAAYSAARRREHEATSEAQARHWRRVALAVARKTRRRVGLDISTRMEADANLTAEGNADGSSRAPLSDLDPREELKRLVPEAMTRSVRIPKRLRYWRRHAERSYVRR